MQQKRINELRVFAQSFPRDSSESTSWNRFSAYQLSSISASTQLRITQVNLRALKNRHLLKRLNVLFCILFLKHVVSNFDAGFY